MARKNQCKTTRGDGKGRRVHAAKEPRNEWTAFGQVRTSNAPRVDFNSGGGGGRAGKGKKRQNEDEVFDDDEHYLGGEPASGSDDDDASGSNDFEGDDNEGGDDQYFDSSHGFGQTQGQMHQQFATHARPPHFSPPKQRASKARRPPSPSSQFQAQMAQKDEELKILRQQLATMQQAFKAIQEQQKADQAQQKVEEEAPKKAKRGKKTAQNDAMTKRIRDVVTQKVSKTHPFVPSAEYVPRACEMIINLLDVAALLGDTDDAKLKRKEFVADYGNTCCKAFNHARTYAQQQVRKEVMILLKKAKDWDKEVPNSDEIKEMCLCLYSLVSLANLKKAIFYVDKLLPSIARGKSS